jgi:hypothetical protein
MSYKFKYKRKFFWTRITVIGHGYDATQDKMVLYMPTGAIREIAHWRDCEVQLGTDWKLAQQKAMEDKAGVSVPLKV